MIPLIAKELYIVRHGQTDYNKKGIVQGRGVNSSLNDTGRQQALAFFKAYSRISFDAIFASSQFRSQQTVAPFETLAYTVQHRTELDEMNWGLHEGRKADNQMRTEYKYSNEQWAKGNYVYKLPESESPLEVQTRLLKFLHELKAEKLDKVLICTHGRTARILLCTLLNKELRDMSVYTHENTGLSKLVWDDRFQQYNIHLLANRQHLGQK